MFPVTVTIHTAAQLNAVLMAMQPQLSAADFKSAAVGAAYEEVSARVAAHQAGEPTTAELVQIAKDRATQPEKEAAAGKPAATTAGAARSSRTATALAADAPEKTAGASDQSAANAEAEPPASTAAEPITYEKVRASITALAKTRREHVVDTLAKFGAKTGSGLKPEQYADFLAELEA